MGNPDLSIAKIPNRLFNECRANPDRRPPLSRDSLSVHTNHDSLS
jgi:hypothetical protein